MICITLVQAFPTLVLKVQNYTHTDGTYAATSTCSPTMVCLQVHIDAADCRRVVPLFVAEGTLPMFYQARRLPLAVAFIVSCGAQ